MSASRYGLTNCYTCLLCGEEFWNVTETKVIVKRTERDETNMKTTVWQGEVCDKCLNKILKVGFDD